MSILPAVQAIAKNERDTTLHVNVGYYETTIVLNRLVWYRNFQMDIQSSAINGYAFKRRGLEFHMDERIFDMNVRL